MISPFLKWAGGKRWLVNWDILPVPDNYDRYIEPFLGGGAVFFHLRPANSVLSDLNEELILLYRIIRDEPEELYRQMLLHHKSHSKSYYYKMRNSTKFDDLKKAARFLYLNRTCWNGLYRVNLKGEFNVPIGTKSSVLFNTDDFVAISKVLRGAKLKCADFEEIIDDTKEGDFLFVDPPYTIKHNYNNFLKYNEKIFSWDDQIRLKNVISNAAQRGVAIAVTNADHAAIRSLYEGFGEYLRLHRHSVLAADSAKRSASTEALFTANLVG